MITLPTLDTLSDDRRGVSEVLGAVLVFALVLLLLILVQVTAVPVANQQLEFEHNKRALDDVQSFDLAVDRAAATGLGASTSIEAGVRYPTRLFLINPPPATGAVRTTGAGTFELDGFLAGNPETADYLDATGGSMPFETTALEYEPSYNEYQNYPVTRYESGLVYDQYRDGTVVRDTGALVSGTRITLVSLAGSMSTSSVDNIVLETAPISAPSRPMSVSAPSGVSPSVVVQTGLSEDQWREDVLESAYDPSGAAGNDRYVSGVTCLEAGVGPDQPCDGRLQLTFEPDVTYDLRMAKVGIGQAFDEEPAWYLTTPQTATITVPSGGSQELTVEARDRFNNPVSGVSVDFDIATTGAGSFVGSHTDVATDEDGRATVVFAADPDFEGGTVDLTATAGDLGDDPDGNGDPVEAVSGAVGDHEVVDYGGRLTVAGPPGEGTDDDGLDINPNSTGKIALVSTSAVGGSGSDTVTLTFESKTGGPVDLVGGRVNYHSTGGPGASAGSSPTKVLLGGTVLEVSGEFRTLDTPQTITESGTALQLEWIDDDGDPVDIQADHLYILTLEFEGGTVERYETYFVSHPK